MAEYKWWIDLYPENMHPQQKRQNPKLALLSQCACCDMGLLTFLLFKARYLGGIDKKYPYRNLNWTNWTKKAPWSSGLNKSKLTDLQTIWIIIDLSGLLENNVYKMVPFTIYGRGSTHAFCMFVLMMYTAAILDLSMRSNHGTFRPERKLATKLF